MNFGINNILGNLARGLRFDNSSTASSLDDDIGPSDSASNVGYGPHIHIQPPYPAPAGHYDHHPHPPIPVHDVGGYDVVSPHALAREQVVSEFILEYMNTPPTLEQADEFYTNVLGITLDEHQAYLSGYYKEIEKHECFCGEALSVLMALREVVETSPNTVLTDDMVNVLQVCFDLPFEDFLFVNKTYGDVWVFVCTQPGDDDLTVAQRSLVWPPIGS